MGNRLQILTEEGSLDLPQDAYEKFYVTRQVHDIQNFETKNADFTKTLKLPATPTNVEILDAYIGAVKTVISTIPCQVIIDGITIAPRAVLLFTKTIVSNERIEFDVQILYGNFNLFESIDEGTIDEMNWADLSTEWLMAQVVPLMNNTTDMVWPACDWNSRDSLGFDHPPNLSINKARLIDINQTGFFIYCKEIIKRIIEEAGFTLVLADNLPSDFDQIALACPIDKFVTFTSDDQLSFSNFVSKTIDQVVVGEATTERGLFELVNSNTSGWWQVAEQEWLVGTTGPIKISLDGSVTYVEIGQRPDSEIRIMQNLVVVASFVMDDSLPAFTRFFISAEIAVIAGDILYVEIFNSVTQTTTTLHPASVFKISTPGSDADRTVQPSEYMPQLNKSEFLANMLKLFNLVIETNDVTLEVFVSPFDDVFTAKEQDLTGFLDGGLNDIETKHSIDSLGQVSRFEWLQDNLLRRNANVELKFRNQLLAKDKTTISMFFSACDNSVLYFSSAVDTFLKAKMPMNKTTATNKFPTLDITVLGNGQFTLALELDFQVGDFLAVGTNVAQTTFAWNRIVVKNDDLSGVFQLPVTVQANQKVLNHITNEYSTFDARLAIIREDGGEDSIFVQNGSQEGGQFMPAGSLTANWMDSLKMNEITETHYKRILDALRNPEVIKAWYNIPTALFVELDFSRPIYMSNFNAFYYMNKINQFKPDSRVQIELVRISNFE